MIGFVASMPSGFRMLKDKLIKEIISQVDFDIKTVLLTSKTSATEIIEHIRYTGANTVQLVDKLKVGNHGMIKAALPQVGIIQVIHVEDESAIDEALEVQNNVDYILLDSGTPKSNKPKRILGGTGQTHNWDISKRVVNHVNKPVYLAGGLAPDNVEAAIKKVKPHGVDICSGLRDPKWLIESKLKELKHQLNTFKK